MIPRWPTQNQRRHFTSRVSGKKRSKTRTKSWRHLLPKRHSPPDEVPGRRPKVKSSTRTGRLGLHHRARAGTHFDGANERGWNADSAHLAKSRNAKGIDFTHDLFAIRHTARRFHRGLSQQLTSDFRPLAPPATRSCHAVARALAEALREGGSPFSTSYFLLPTS